MDQVERAIERVIPANPGFEAVTFWFEDGEEDPENVDIRAKLQRETVIAWRAISDDCYAPICVFGSPGGERAMTAVIDPAGAVIDPPNTIYAGLDRWDRRSA